MTHPIVTNTRTIDVVTLNRKGGSLSARWLCQHTGYNRRQRLAASEPAPRPEVKAPIQFKEVVPEPITASEAVSEVTPDLTAKWNVDTAKEAFRLLAKSGKSKTAFAKEHGFSRSRFNTWESRVS